MTQELSVQENSRDVIREQLMDNMLSDKVAVTIGNAIFLPPIENPTVTNIDRVENLLKDAKIIDNYAVTNIKVDDQPVVLLTHISRICNETITPSLKPFNIEYFNKEELKKVFKNEFPALVTNTIKQYIEFKINNGLLSYEEAEEFKFVGLDYSKSTDKPIKTCDAIIDKE